MFKDMNTTFAPSPAFAGTPVRGFPIADTQIHEWTPGISTPSGFYTGAISQAVLSDEAASHIFANVTEGVTRALIAIVSIGVPLAAVAFGISLFQ